MQKKALKEDAVPHINEVILRNEVGHVHSERVLITIKVL